MYILAPHACIISTEAREDIGYSEIVIIGYCKPPWALWTKSRSSERATTVLNYATISLATNVTFKPIYKIIKGLQIYGVPWGNSILYT